MLFYFILFFIFSSLGILDLAKIRKKYKAGLFISLVLLLIILGGIRWKTGTDWGTYYDFFKQNSSYNDFHSGQFEVGYAIINFLIKSLTNNYTVFLIILSFLIISIKSVYIYEHTEYILIALLLYFAYFFGDIFFVRQSLALSLTLYSTNFIIKRQKIKFLITVLIASTIHISALFFLIAYFVYHLRVSNLVLLLFLFVCILLSIVNFDVVLFKLILKVIGDSTKFGEKLHDYLFIGAAKRFGMQVSGLTSILLGGIKRLLILPVLFLFRKKIEKKYSEYGGYLNLLIVGNGLYYLTIHFVALQRISTYFYFYEILLLLMLLASFNWWKERLLLYMGLIVYAALKLIYSIAAYPDLFIPYYSIFDQNIPRVYH
jgi:EpsG family